MSANAKQRVDSVKMKVLTELKVVARAEQRGLQLAQHGRGELERLAEVV